MGIGTAGSIEEKLRQDRQTGNQTDPQNNGFKTRWASVEEFN